ncbi:MAG TPA: ribbon-helix-helix protein, CopG family [Xanthomonadales bacterium]|nr:ribbon-helix-helix protein, CopG family [Xanthomonadales bacterium]
MKTITLKADPKFDAELTALAERLHTTKSAVIREAVGEYVAQLDREEMRKKLLAASLRVREQNLEELEVWDETLADGLDETEDLSEVLK